MAQYIDADELMRKFTMTSDGTRIPDVNCDNFPITFTMRDVKRLIREAPTADVVPKSEVERLSHKCDDCAGCTQWKCDCANIELEVAREIFEELRNVVSASLATPCFSYLRTLPNSKRNTRRARNEQREAD